MALHVGSAEQYAVGAPMITNCRLPCSEYCCGLYTSNIPEDDIGNYIYVYISMHVYIHIYTHVYISLSLCLSSWLAIYLVILQQGLCTDGAGPAGPAHGPGRRQRALVPGRPPGGLAARPAHVHYVLMLWTWQIDMCFSCTYIYTHIHTHMIYIYI